MTFSFKQAIEAYDMPIIQGQIRGQEVNLLLDTGADICYLDTNLAEDLELPIIGCKDLITAGSNIDGANIYQVKLSLKQPNQDEFLVNIDCVGLELSHISDEKSIKIHGILGVNFFKQLNAQISFLTGELFLNPKTK